MSYHCRLWSTTTQRIQQKRYAKKRLVSLKAKQMATNISSQSVAARAKVQSHLKSKEEKKKKREEEEKEMGSFGRINEFLLEKCLKPWDWLFSPNEVDEGGKTKVRGLKLRPTRTFLGKLIVALSCAPTGLTNVVGIQDHGLKIGLWVSWLKVYAQENIFGAYIHKKKWPIRPYCMWGAIVYTKKNKFLCLNGI